MTTQYTSILKLALPVQGELSGTWGDVVNDNITSMVEEAVAGRAVINTWTTNSHVLTTADGTTSEARCAMLEFTDTGAALTGAATVVCPSASKLYVCKNDSGQQVTIQTAAGTGVAIPDGQTMFVFCDGTNVEQCETNFNSLSYNGYTLNFGGAVTTAGAFTTSGAYALTLTTTGATNVTLPTTGTLATLDGTETLTNKTLTAPTISSPSLTGSISATDLTISGNTTIGDAAADTLTVNSTITSNLIFTDDTYDIGATGATRPRNLYLSGNATIGGTVTLSGGIDVTGALGVDGDFDVNTDKFTVASATGNTLVAGTLGVTGITTATGGLNADTISEITAAGGVTVDGVLLKDGGATLTGALDVQSTITSDGLTVDGDVLLNGDRDLHLVASNPNAGTSFQYGEVTFGDASSSQYSNHAKIIANGNYANQSNLEFHTSNNNSSPLRMKISEIGDITFYDTNDLPSFVYDESAGSTFNEQGENKDFRVESDSNANMLFVDAGANHVNIGTATDLGGILNVNGTLALGDSPTLNWGSNTLTLESRNAIGVLALSGASSGFNPRMDFLDGTGALAHRISTDGGVTFNETGGIQDFRVEGNTEEYMLFVDGSADKVGIGQDAPAAKLHINSQDVGSVTNLIVSQLGNTSGTSLVAQEFKFNEGGVPGVKLMAGKNAFAGSDFYIYTGQASNGSYVQRMKFYGAATTSEGGVVFNEDSYDQDFRVESDGSTHALFVDASTNRVGINDASPSQTFTVVSSDTNASRFYGSGGHGLYSYHDGGGTGWATGTGTGYDNLLYLDETNDKVEIYTGGLKRFEVSANETTFNEIGADTDFRVESDGETHMLFVDALNNRVGIGTSGPGSTLTVDGDILSNWGNSGEQKIGINARSANLFSATGKTLVVTGADAIAGAQAMAGGDVIVRGGVGAGNEGLGIYAGHLYLEGGLHTAGVGTTSGAGRIYMKTAGKQRLNINQYGQVVINEDDEDSDFRVESLNQPHMIFVDAANDTVSVGGSQSLGTLSVLSVVDGTEAAPHFAIQGAVSNYRLNMWLDTTAAYIGQDSTIRQVRIYSGGETAGVALVNGGTSWGTFSDERLKENVEPVENALQSLSGLRTVKYHLKDVDGPEDKKKIGVIAQDLVGVLDEVIDPTFRPDDDTEYMGVRYTELVPVLIKAIQEQQTIIETLEARITALENA